jgi:predicted O-methyltransferase YrrM
VPAQKEKLIQGINKQHQMLSNLGGYLCDLVGLAQGAPINLHGYMKYLALRSLGKRTGAKCLIESGTFLGVTAARCSRVFERVLTIELDVGLATQATAYLQRFRNKYSKEMRLSCYLTLSLAMTRVRLSYFSTVIIQAEILHEAKYQSQPFLN